MFKSISLIGEVTTAIAVWELAEGRKQARTELEDTLSHEYRDLLQNIPVKALLGEPLSETEYAEAHDELYRYVDLSNEQVFLRKNGRVSVETWQSWASGIEANLALPAYDKFIGGIALAARRRPRTSRRSSRFWRDRIPIT